MSETCDGRHMCEPPLWPTGPGEHWTCTECGRGHQSEQVKNFKFHGGPPRGANPEAWGWTSSSWSS